MYKFSYNYINTINGEKFILCKVINGKKKSVFIIDKNDNYYPLPNVSKIRYDKEKNVLFVTDKVPVFDDYTCHISYYLDFYGNVIGKGFCDYDGRLLDIKLTGKISEIPFLDYELFKIKLKVEIAKELYKNEGDLTVGYQKMLSKLQKIN